MGVGCCVAALSWCEVRDPHGSLVPQSRILDPAGYTYNDLESVERAVERLGGDVAAIFVGACSYPYSAPTAEPTAEFASGE